MEANYYYLVASLPMLSFESKLPFTLESFLDGCKEQLSREDYLLVENIATQEVHPRDTRSAIFNRWAKFTQDFKNEETWFRAQAAGKDPANYIRGERAPDPSFTETLQQAQKSDNPLEAQKSLDRFRWRFLDAMEFGNNFTFGKVLIYALKLRILERYARIESPVGEKIFEELEEVEIPLGLAHQI